MDEAPALPPARALADLPRVVKSMLRYVDDLNWFEPSDLRFVEAVDRGTRDTVYVFEYVPTGRHLFLDRRGRGYQYVPPTDPNKSGAFRLRYHGSGVEDLRPELRRRTEFEAPYEEDEWDPFASESHLRLLEDEGRSTACYGDSMRREITQRELRNESGEIMRALDRGDEFVVTRNGVPVGELLPLRRKHFVSAEAVVAAFRGAPRVDFKQFRADVDAYVDQDPTPRG